MATQLNIKDAETVELARRIAHRRGMSVTSVIRDALRKEPEAAAAKLPELTLEQQARFDAVKALVNGLPKGLRRPWSEIEAEFDEINAFAYEQ